MTTGIPVSEWRKEPDVVIATALKLLQTKSKG